MADKATIVEAEGASQGSSTADAVGASQASVDADAGVQKSTNLPRLRRRRRFLVFAVLITAAACIDGIFFDESVRPDPFTAKPTMRDWLFNWQPHPALARLPVVPIGEYGSLTYRPNDTSWINSLSFPETLAK